MLVAGESSVAVDPGSESRGPDDTAEASHRASAIGEELEDLGVEVVFWRVEGP